MAFSDWTALAPEWSRLQAFYFEVRSAQAGSEVPAELWGKINNALTVAANGIARLNQSGDLGKALIAGTITPSTWAATANSIGRGLAATLAEINSTPFDRTDPGYTSTGSTGGGGRTWSDVAAAAQDTIAAAGKAATVGVGALIVFLGLLVALKVLK